MSLITERFTAPYQAGETATFVRRVAQRSDTPRPGVIFCHAAGTDDTQALALTSLLNPLAAAGYPVLSVHAAGDAWGNDTALARVTAARTYLQGTLGAASGGVVLVGASMGGGLAYAWARANKAQVRCLVQLVPVSDLNDMVVNNRGGQAASINNAYDGTYSNAAHGPTHNPASFAAQLAGLPVQVWYGLFDDIVPPATVIAVTNLIGASVDLRAQPYGHSFGSVDFSPVLPFVQAHAA